MLERRDRFALGRVFSFTFLETVKAKANIVSVVLLVLIVALSIPVYSLLSAGKAKSAPSAAVQVLESAGIPEEARAVLAKDAQYAVSAPDAGESVSFGAAYAASIAVMFVSVMASSYIVRSVTEEKVSKLAETLTLSVDPFTLALGKILAILAFVAGMFALMILAGVLSYAVTGALTDISPVRALLASLAEGFAHTGASAIAVCAVTLVLGIAGFAFLAGFTGAGCATVEDTGNAMGAPVLLIMACYMFSIFASTMEIPGWLCAVPFLSVFLAPVRYLSGAISFGTVALSWALQLLVTLLLARMCGRVYRGLMFYNGARLKFFRMLAYALKRGKEGA